MEFDEMKVVWDSQEGKRMYAVDEAALHAMVRRRGRSIARCVIWFELVGVLGALLLGAAILSEPLFERHDYHQIPGGLMWLMVSVYLLMGRLKRLRSERGFDDSLRGDLDKAIARIDYQVDRLRMFVWWYVLPIVAGSVFSFVWLYGKKPVWIWPALVVCLVVGWLEMRYKVRHRYLPRKRELEGLREKLVGEGGDAEGFVSECEVDGDDGGDNEDDDGGDE